jgi:hypothetical protein
MAKKKTHELVCGAPTRWCSAGILPALGFEAPSGFALLRGSKAARNKERNLFFYLRLIT